MTNHARPWPAIAARRKPAIADHEIVVLAMNHYGREGLVISTTIGGNLGVPESVILIASKSDHCVPHGNF